MFQTTNQIWILDQNECLMDFYESGSNESNLNEIYYAHMLHGAGIFTNICPNQITQLCS